MPVFSISDDCIVPFSGGEFSGSLEDCMKFAGEYYLTGEITQDNMQTHIVSAGEVFPISMNNNHTISLSDRVKSWLRHMR